MDLGTQFPNATTVCCETALPQAIGSAKGKWKGGEKSAFRPAERFDVSPVPVLFLVHLSVLPGRVMCHIHVCRSCLVPKDATKQQHTLTAGWAAPRSLGKTLCSPQHDRGQVWDAPAQHCKQSHSKWTRSIQHKHPLQYRSKVMGLCRTHGYYPFIAFLFS